MLKNYIQYLKDNPQGYWFKNKLYGWGWTPARWQGWAVIVIFVGLIILNTYRLNPSLNPTNTGAFVIETFLLVIILIAICYKTGEKPRWRWGIKNSEKNNPR